MMNEREVLGLFMRQVTDMRACQQKYEKTRKQSAAIAAREAEGVVDKALRVLASNNYRVLEWKQGELL